MNKHQEYNSSSEAGFTLLELVIAITLIAVMSVGVWSALETCVRSWSRGIETIDLNQRERSTYDLVRKQIASAYPLPQSAIVTASGTQTTAVTQTAAVRTTSSAASNTPIFSGGETSMRFITPNSLVMMDSTGLVLVTYEVEIDSDNNISLVQREMPYTGQDVDNGSFIRYVPVFRNLKECTFEYYFSGDANNPAEWLTEWDTATRRRLPAAVRISMLFNESDKSSLPGRQMIIPFRAQNTYQASQTQQTSITPIQMPGGQTQQPKSNPGQSTQPKPKPGGGGMAKPGGGGMAKPGGGGMAKPGGGGMAKPGGGGMAKPGGGGMAKPGGGGMAKPGGGGMAKPGGGGGRF